MSRPTNYPCLGFAAVLSGMLATVTSSGVRLFGASWWSTVGAGALVLLVFTGLAYVALEHLLNGDLGDDDRPGLEDGGGVLRDLSAHSHRERATTQHLRRLP